jgi:hypothetical protein
VSGVGSGQDLTDLQRRGLAALDQGRLVGLRQLGNQAVVRESHLIPR